MPRRYTGFNPRTPQQNRALIDGVTDAGVRPVTEEPVGYTEADLQNDNEPLYADMMPGDEEFSQKSPELAADSSWTDESTNYAPQKFQGTTQAGRNPLDFAEAQSDYKMGDSERRNAINQYILANYNKASDSSGVDDARKSANRTNTIANIGNALDSMVTAKGRVYGGAGPNNAYWQGLKSDAQGNLRGAEEDRKAKIADFISKQQMRRQGTQDLQQQKEWDVKNAMNDPLSGVSKMSQIGFMKMFPDLAKSYDREDGTSSIGDMSAADIDRLAKQYQTKVGADSMNEFRKAQIGASSATNALATEKLNMAKDERNIPKIQSTLEADGKPVFRGKDGSFIDAGGNPVDPAKIKKSAKAPQSPKAYDYGVPNPENLTEEQTRNYQGQQFNVKAGDSVKREINKQLDSSRAGKSYNQAKLDLYSANKALAIFENYPDLNSMPPDQVSLLRSEIAKIAKGGVPDQHEMKVQDAPTAAAKIQAARQYFANAPQGAKQGEFLKNSRKYLEELRDIAKEEVMNTKGNIVMNNGSMISKRDLDDYMVRNPEIAEAAKYYTPRLLPRNEEKKPEAQPAPQQPAQAEGKRRLPPGTIVNVKGKRYSVGADGESLTLAP